MASPQRPQVKNDFFSCFYNGDHALDGAPATNHCLTPRLSLTEPLAFSLLLPTPLCAPYPLPTSLSPGVGGSTRCDRVTSAVTCSFHSPRHGSGQWERPCWCASLILAAAFGFFCIFSLCVLSGMGEPGEGELGEICLLCVEREENKRSAKNSIRAWRAKGLLVRRHTSGGVLWFHPEAAVFPSCATADARPPTFTRTPPFHQ